MAHSSRVFFFDCLAHRTYQEVPAVGAIHDLRGRGIFCVCVFLLRPSLLLF